MTLKLHHLRPAPGAKTAKTRVGRGEGSKGKTAGRGTKGTKARYQVPAAFEGGQMPIHMRLPKLKGFKNPFKVEFQVVNLDRISDLFPEGGTVGVDDLVAKGAVRDGHPVKVLGQGDISVAVAGERARVLGLRQGEDRGRRRHRHGDLIVRMTERWGADGTVVTGSRPRPDAQLRACGAPVRLPRVFAGSSARAAPRWEKEDLVLGAFANAFRTPDLRRKLLFVLLIIVVFRLGSQIPAPGVNVANVQSCLDDVAERRRLQPDQPVLRRSAAPAHHLRARDHAVHHREHHPAAARRGHPAARGPQEGGPGRPDEDHAVHPLPHARPGGPPGHRHRGAGPLRPACSQSCQQDLLYNNDTTTFLVMVLTMTAGTAVIMWLGELITDRGIGNGMSILIFTQVVATFPSRSGPGPAAARAGGSSPS